MKLFSQYRGLPKEVYVIALCKIIDRLGMLVGPMFTLILSAKLGFSASRIALWSLGFSLIAFPCQMAGGKLADRYNKKVIINICDILSSCIFFLCGILSLSETVIVFYLFGSLLQHFESSSYNVLVADICSYKDRERAHSLLYLCSNFGLILAPVIGGVLMNEHCSLLFIISAVTQLASIIVFDFSIKETKMTADSENRYESFTDKKNLIQVLKDNYPVFLFTIVLSVQFLTYHQFQYILPLDFNAVYGDNGSLNYGYVSSLNCITVLLMTSFVTARIRNIDSLTKMAIGEVFELAGYLLFIFGISSMALCLLASFVFTIGEIIETISSSPYTINRIPANYRGRVTAFNETFTSLFQSLTTILIGMVYDSSGSKAAWTIIIVLYFFIIAAFLLLKKTDRKVYPDLYR